MREVNIVKKTNGLKIVARNKKATHDYYILDDYEAGIVLTGTEIKSIRASKVSIQDAYIQIKNGKAIIVNMHIAKFDQGNIFNHQETRNRDLLLHKKEIRKLDSKVRLEGLTIIPLEVYLKSGLAKIKIALTKGKKEYDKRDTLKEEALNKEKRRNLKY